MQTIEKYIKNLNNIDSNEIISPRLFQSKSYLKILDISYFIKDTNLPIFADIIKIVIKSTYIFINTVLAFRPQIIKISLKLDMAIIRVNIKDSQSSIRAKNLINKYFNVGYYIVTIQETNINSDVPQCKNC